MRSEADFKEPHKTKIDEFKEKLWACYGKAFTRKGLLHRFSHKKTP